MITIKVEGLDKLNFKNSKSIIARQVNEAIRKSTEVVKQNVKRKAPVFDGTLKKAITSKTRNLYGEVGIGESAEKYGYVQEYGRKSHKLPPVGALKKWARVKLGDENLAYPLARSIAAKGTKPQPFFEPGVQQSMSSIESFINNAGAKIVSEL